MRTGTGAGRRTGAPPEQGPVGRVTELAEGISLLSDSAVRLLTFTGPPGVGKTCLARAVLDQAPVTGLEVPLESVTRYDELLEAVARALEVTLAGPPGSTQLIAGRVAEDHMVLLLDGCDDLTGAPHPVQQLLDACDGLRMVATALGSLRVPGERVVGLDPLPLPDGGPDQLASSPAVTLFCRRAAAVEPSFAPSEEDLAAIASLVRRVHGLPLGIELLAVQVLGQSPRSILDGLDHGLEVTERHTRRGRDAHRLSLRDALVWSYRRLPPTAAVVLRRMAVFEAPAVIDQILAVVAAPSAEGDKTTAEVLDAVADLVDRRLLEPHPGPGEPAYGLVDLVRDFAAEELVDQGELVPVLAAHGRAMLSFAVDRAAAVDAAQDDFAQHEMERAERDIRTALRRLVAEPDVTDGLRLAVATAPFVLRRGWDGWVSPALSSMLRRADRVAAEVRAAALLWRGRLVSAYEGPRAADAVCADLEEGLRLARDSGSSELVLLGLSFRMLALPATGDVGGAAAAAAEGLPLAEVSGDVRWQARFAAWAGMVAHQAGDLDHAVALADLGLRRAEDAADARALLILALLVGGMPPDRNAHLVARLPDIDDLVVMSQRLEDRGLEPLLLLVGAAQALATGDLQKVAARCAASLRLAARQAAWHDLPYTVLVMVVLAVTRGDFEDGARFHGMVQDRLDELAAGLPPFWVDVYRHAVDGAHVALGTTAFERLVEQGAQDASSDALSGLLAYAERAGARREADRRRRADRDPESGRELTPREREVLSHLVTGATNREISQRLGSAPKTVMHHTEAIYRKLGVRGRAEATAWAFRHGLVD